MAAKWQRHVSRRCPNFAKTSHDHKPHDPCLECYSIESFWRVIPYEPDSNTEIVGEWLLPGYRAGYDRGSPRDVLDMD